jgi:hypothetical protein
VERQRNGLEGNEELLRDYKEREKHALELKKELLDVQHRYQQLTGENAMDFNKTLFQNLKNLLEKKKRKEGEGEEEVEEGEWVEAEDGEEHVDGAVVEDAAE